MRRQRRGHREALAAGMGKLDGARTYHRAMEDCSFEDLAYGIHEVMLRDGNLLAGLMIVELIAPFSAPPE